MLQYMYMCTQVCNIYVRTTAIIEYACIYAFDCHFLYGVIIDMNISNCNLSALYTSCNWYRNEYTIHKTLAIITLCYVQPTRFSSGNLQV